MASGSQENQHGVCGKVREEKTSESGPDEGDHTRDRRFDAMQIDESSYTPSRGLRIGYRDGFSPRIGRWRRAPTHT